MLQTKTYSVGSFDRYTGASNGYILDLILTEESVDQAANTSEVSYKLRLRSGDSNRFSWELTAVLDMDGVRVAESTAENYLDYNSTWVLLEGRTTVSHGPDGTLDMAFSAAVTAWDGGTQYTPPAMTVSGTMALTRIPRASSVAAAGACIGSTAAIAVGRKSAAYSHSIHYQFGALSGYLADAAGTHADTEVMLTDTALLFPLPESFYSQIPDAPAGSCTLTCTTYSGDTRIGEPQTAAFTVTADPALCSPRVGGRAEDVNEATLALTGDGHILVQGKSAAACTVEAAARQGASVTALYVNGGQLEGSTCTLENVATANVVFRACDSRGYSTEYTVPGLTLVPYVSLSFNLSAARTDPTGGGGVLTVQGKWYGGSFGARDNGLSALYRVNGGQWQTLAVRTDGGDFAAELTLTGLDYQRGHTIEVQIADCLETVTKSVSISKGIPVFDWGEEDFAFHVPVTFTATDGTRFLLDLQDGRLTAAVQT